MLAGLSILKGLEKQQQIDYRGTFLREKTK
jgi:hypothetical protein